MRLEKFKSFFKRKSEDSIKETNIDNLSIDKFNDWFQNTYDGYGGYPGGAKGIYLRTDKLSIGMISDYFTYLNITGDEYRFMNKIINNWLKQK